MKTPDAAKAETYAKNWVLTNDPKAVKSYPLILFRGWFQTNRSKYALSQNCIAIAPDKPLTKVDALSQAQVGAHGT